MGNGVPKDHANAVTWFREAAERNFAPAQLMLGFLYGWGVGVPQDNVSGTEAGFQRYLAKPVDPTELALLVRALAADPGPTTAPEDARPSAR